MAKTPVQNYEHHTKWDPITHFILGPLFLINLLVRIAHVYRHPGIVAGWEVVLAIGLILLNVKVRLYSLRIQDRLIRAEERQRLAALVPEPLRSRLDELTVGQLIALRFASDAEVPTLVQRAVVDRMNGKDIKKAIQVWRPDYLRV